MILQALKEYYDRKAEDPESGMAPPGFEWKEIPFIIVLATDGTPISIEDTYEGEGRNRRAKRFLVPQAVKKTSGIAANLFWDNPEYVLGVPLKGKPERVSKQHEAFKERLDDIGEVEDEGFRAVRSFLVKDHKEQLLQGLGDCWQTLLKEGGNLTFRLAGDQNVILERPAIRAGLATASAKGIDGEHGVCLVTGGDDIIERLHPSIKGVYGAKSSGANIVSFNLDAFRSFNKNQGVNAPVGKAAAFAYTTALNHLLSKGSRQRMQVGDASTIFWAEKATAFEQRFADFFGEPPKDDPDRGAQAVEGLFKSVDTGAFS
ncbi:MAG: type I-C CRISPR-associated protein Cas8c/Csd1, partial [Deltaproteobacteria bacterium]|nr:type I-C CRISPR-associated protein Cas8c/Csd1 [Deltaproteobacteria bacterium]